MNPQTRPMKLASSGSRRISARTSRAQVGDNLSQNVTAKSLLRLASAYSAARFKSPLTYALYLDTKIDMANDTQFEVCNASPLNLTINSNLCAI